MEGYRVKDGTIELGKEGKLWTVANWTTDGECRWMQHFKTIEQARAELARFKHLKTGELSDAPSD